jgi:hypothetical protein
MMDDGFLGIVALATTTSEKFMEEIFEEMNESVSEYIKQYESE